MERRRTARRRSCRIATYFHIADLTIRVVGMHRPLITNCYPMRYPIGLPRLDKDLRNAKKCFAIHGERGGTRTLDPMIKSHVLYHLSYALTCRAV